MQVAGRGFVESMASCVERRVAKTAAAVLAPYEQIVEVTAAGAITINLPPVSEAAGRLYSIVAINGGTHTVTVSAYASGESYDWPGDASLNADLDRALYFSDGRKWWLLTDQYS